MNLYLRLLLVWLQNIGRAKRCLSCEIKSSFRVLPNDIDVLGHMNNGRYLQIMDVARVDWMLQTKAADAIRKNRWTPLLGGGLIRYCHSLKMGQAYNIHSRLLGWDHRWFYLEHCFRDARGRCVAIGISRAGLRRADEWVNTADVIDWIEPGTISPPLPAHILEWVDVEERTYRQSAGLGPRSSQPECYGRA